MEIIIGRNLALKRERDVVYLPTLGSLHFMATPFMSNRQYYLSTITNYDEQNGTLELRILPGLIDNRLFQVSVEVNSDFLMSLRISRIIVKDESNRDRLPFMHPPVGITSNSNSRFIKNEAPAVSNLSNIKSRDVQSEIKQPTKITESYNVDIPLKEVKFSDGEVTFLHYVRQASRTLTFHVKNTTLKKEYDSIKNYFSKALGLKKFTFSIQIEFEIGRPIQASASSPHIDKIDANLFERVEDLYIDDFFASNSADEVYDAKERASKSALEIGSAKLNDTDHLLNKLITKEKTKHYYHLRYLSHNHLSDLFNLHLTGNPLSFIFLLPNDNDYCFVWETYNTSEATYLWKIRNTGEKGLRNRVNELIERIKWLRRKNKFKFLQDKPDGFTRIEHDYRSDDMGFKKWKAQLDGFLSSE
ncbi:MAG: hypothetical protein EOP48_01750 [Sphingobacteriales bacterium]|nr:MAG: hypothetical protein EOP48_01750 [Sphingobacteriales bacterium]